MAFGDLNIVPGVIYFKVTPKLEQTLDMNPVQMNSDGFVSFNNFEVDRVLRENGVKQVKQVLKDSTPLKQLHRKFTDKHKKLGLHRWYEIKFPEIIDPESIIYKLKQMNIGWDMESFFAPPVYELFWTPNDTLFPEMWALNNTGQTGGTPGADIGMIEAWNIEKGDPEVVVAVMDGGIDYTHQDLAQNMWIDPDTGLHGYNFYNDSNMITPSRHGTHVAGTIAAVNNNGTGVSGIAGGDGSPNSGVRIMCCQVFPTSGSSSNMQAFYNSYIWAADKGAAISQNSWGGTGNDPLLEQSINYFINENNAPIIDKGIVIAAAGNNDSEDYFRPAQIEGVLSVAAIDHNFIKAGFSNYGEHIDISAPGVSILSSVLSDSYELLNGTSMACPHVSGVAALVLSRFKYQYQASQIEYFITQSAEYIDNLNNRQYQNKLGSGALNAHRAMQFAEDAANGNYFPSKIIVSNINLNEIYINWEVIDSENYLKTLICVSTSKNFGTPDPTYNYSEGDLLAGGGKVLYFGDATNTVIDFDVDSNGTTYYYQAWNLNNTNDNEIVFSLPLKRFITSKIDYSVVNSFYINFLNETDYLTNKSIEIKKDTAYTNDFVVSKFDGGLAIPDYYLNNYIEGSTVFRENSVIIKKFNFTGQTTVGFVMQHYFKAEQTIISSSKGLIQYTLNNGKYWKTITEFTETSDNPALYEVDLSDKLAGKKEVMFRLKYSAIGKSKDNFWCIGSINITSS
jgi:hypothetical protein